MKNDLIGIINIGASAFRMRITEFYDTHERELDSLIKPLWLGEDTFTQGYISLEKVKEATAILQKFKLKLDEYGVKDYRALCTSGVREARNKDFFIDYVGIHTGIKLEILEPSEEIYIKYVGAKNNVLNFNQLEDDGLIFANVASGNVTLSATKKNCVYYAGALPYGSLRLRQMFSAISHLKRHKAIEQYVQNMIKTVSSTLDPKVNIKNLVGAGSSINLMLRLFSPEDDVITREQLEIVYEKARSLSRNEINEEMSLRKDESSVLVPTLITYLELLNLVKNDRFSFCRLTFPMILSHYFAGRIKDNKFYERAKNTFLAVGTKYRVDTKHSKWVTYFARKLFDSLTDLHSLGKQERDYLEAATILHEVGNYVDGNHSAENSFYIIKTLSVPGWGSKSLLFVACIVYEANKNANDKELTDILRLDTKEYLMIKKLASILRVANALDAGKSRRISDITISIQKNIIIIDAITSRAPYVEAYSFEQQKQLFVETFGIPIELRTKVSYE